MRAYLSATLVDAVKHGPIRRDHLAAQIGVGPNTLCAWINHRTLTKRGDPRVERLGAIVGVPACACYEEVDR